MAPLMDEQPEQIEAKIDEIEAAYRPRLAIIGAGSRGNHYARAIHENNSADVVCVVEPIKYKRELFGSKYIWQNDKPGSGQAFEHWDGFVEYERQRRRDVSTGSAENRRGVDGVFVCVRDEMHVEVITALAPLNLHMLCEKPLAPTLQECLKLQRTIQQQQRRIFGIGHVLRYSPHNMMLRELVLNERAIGDILSIEHTEPVGWSHFSHSYVRGNWRKESFTAPSLLTKSCHDIDWLFWMLCSPPRDKRHDQRPHLPDTISSTGSLKEFRRTRKPAAARDATNCLSCPLEESCLYSAKRIYYDGNLARGNTGWPVDIVNPEIETLIHEGDDGPERARQALLASLAEDYDANSTAAGDIESRAWYGRCVWESDNDVCDDQHVLMEWSDATASPRSDSTHNDSRNAKSASFHMIAQTLSQCQRRGRIYGSTGEIEYDSNAITVHNFVDGSTRTLTPEIPIASHHGGGDDGLVQQFVRAVAAVESGQMGVDEAQVEFLDVTLEEAVRSHAAVFAAEEARKQGRVVHWGDWWEKNVAAFV